MRQCVLLFLSLGPLALFGQTPVDSSQSTTAKQIELATQEVQRIQNMVDIGVESTARLHQAQLDLADAHDNALLKRNLYNNAVKDVDENAIREMLDAAQHRVDRQQERLEHNKELLTQGLVAQSYLTPFEQELTMRQMQFDLARYRARIMQDAVSKNEDAVSKAKQAATEAELRNTAARETASLDEPDFTFQGEEHYEGSGAFDELKDLKPLAQAFEQKFDHPLPISAEGETNLHRAMGFDHRGRVDVAISPKTPEGVWLRHYLQVLKIPYYAFTHAIPGKATAAHIHIGPGSTRLQNAD